MSTRCRLKRQRIAPFDEVGAIRCICSSPFVPFIWTRDVVRRVSRGSGRFVRKIKTRKNRKWKQSPDVGPEPGSFGRRGTSKCDEPNEEAGLSFVIRDRACVITLLSFSLLSNAHACIHVRPHLDRNVLALPWDRNSPISASPSRKRKFTRKQKPNFPYWSCRNVPTAFRLSRNVKTSHDS